jgi:hypothetical protein
MRMKRFCIGIDLGQRRDFSAIAIVERAPDTAPVFDPIAWSTPEPGYDHWVVRHLERIPLGTPYTAVVARIVALARLPKLAGNVELVVDATGVGMPVVDMLRAAGPNCALMPVWITAGRAPSFDGAVWHVPKLDLMARLQTIFESKQIRIAARLPEAGTLVRELLDIRGVHTSPATSKSAQTTTTIWR